MNDINNTEQDDLVARILEIINEEKNKKEADMNKNSYSKERIDQYVINEITQRFCYNEMHKLTFEEFDLNVTRQLKRRNENFELIDVLFKRDKDGFCLLFYIVHEHANHLFSGILNKYEDKLKTMIPNEWDFMLWRNKNDCHNSFTQKYGKNALDEIADIHSNVLFYSEDYFTKYYLMGKLDNFYKKENIEQFKNLTYAPLDFIHTLNFFSSDPDGFKEVTFINGNEKKISDKLKSRESFSKLFFEAKNLNSLDGYIKLNLPGEKDFNILASKLGFEKASEIVSEYINFQNEYIKSFNDYSEFTFKFDSDKMKSLIKAEPKFINCGKSLVMGLQHNSDLLSYFIINDSITKDDLLANIQDKDLAIKSQYSLLNDSLTNKDIESPFKKAKI